MLENSQQTYIDMGKCDKVVRDRGLQPALACVVHTAVTPALVQLRYMPELYSIKDVLKVGGTLLLIYLHYLCPGALTV